jgi:hypothetical protein
MRRPIDRPAAPPAPASDDPPADSVEPAGPSIYLISPSGAVADPARARHAASILAAHGHPARFDAAALKRSQRFAGTDAQRAEAFTRAAAQDAPVVMITRGGYGMTRLLPALDFKALAPGEKVITEHAPVHSLVLVLAGELVVQKEDPAGGSISLSILREGDIAGEIALLKGLRASATVVASRKTAVATLGRVDFEALLKQHPRIREFLDGLSERRLKMIGEAMRPVEILDADELVMESQ